jgi:peptide/nickel transport system substrate-binding protein
MLTGCGQPGEQPSEETTQPREETPVVTPGEPEKGGWLIQRLQAEPGTLNPITGTDAYESLVNSTMMESLIERDPRTLEYKPLLAESWEISEDKLVYTFHLRQGIKWHTGDPFTAEDIIYSYNLLKDPAVNAPHLRGYYKDLEKVEALDDYTVRFTFSTLYYLSFEIAGSLPIVPKAVFDTAEDFNNHPAGRSPVGTGPYRFKEWRTGSEIVVERNPDYWGEAIGRTAYVDQIVFRIAPDENAALQQLKAGQIDMMTRFLPEQWVNQLNSAKVRKNFNKFDFYVPQYSYIGYNSERPFFADKRCRRAMTQLLDRKQFIEEVLYGLAHIVTGNLFFQSPYYNSEIEPWPYDPEQAKQLLDEAGWTDHDGDGIRDKDGVDFDFTFMIPAASSNGEKIAVLMKENLSKVGIRMQIKKLEWALFIERVQERNFDVVTMAWSMPWTVDLYQIWHSDSIGGSNYVSFSHEEADDIIIQLRKTFDEQERIQLCHRFHEIVHEEQPYTFLWCSAELMAVDKRFRDVETFPIRPGYDVFEWWVPKTEQVYP